MKKFFFPLMVVLALTPSLPTYAQSRSQSDVSGTSVTSSDVVNGAFIPGTGRNSRLDFRSTAAQNAVNNAALVVNDRLAAATLPAIAPTAGSNAIAASAQQALQSLLTGTGNVGASATQITNALIAAGISPALAADLVASLQGLTSGGTVSAADLAAAVAAYNAVINASSAELLARPTDELLGINTILSALLNAAITAG